MAVALDSATIKAEKKSLNFKSVITSGKKGTMQHVCQSSFANAVHCDVSAPVIFPNILST